MINRCARRDTSTLLSYCQRIMDRKRRVSTEHFCQVCSFRYRWQDNCYKRMVKKHGWYYLPGRAPQPIPPDELERLLRVFAQADLNSRQRRRAAADSSFRRAPRVESRSPPRRHRHRSPSSGRDTGRGTHGKTAEDDLMDVSPLTLSPASQRRLDRMWEPSTARIRSVRSAAARPAGYESSESLECLPVGLSWPLSDVSDGQSTSPARPRGAVRPLELTEEPRMDYFWGGTVGNEILTAEYS